MSHWLARGAVLLAGVIGMAIQPWSARRLLIEFGGSSAVWSATQVYFIGQLVLANLILSFFPKRWQRWQPILLVVLLTLATLYLWMPKPWTVDSITPQPLHHSVMAGVNVLEPSQSANPVLAIIFWLISRLGILPLGLFLVSPIIQLHLRDPHRRRARQRPTQRSRSDHLRTSIGCMHGPMPAACWA